MKAAIKQFITEQLISGSTQVDLATDDDLLGSGLVDSMGLMRLVAFIEETYNVQIPAEDLILEHFMTIDAINDYLQTRK